MTGSAGKRLPGQDSDGEPAGASGAQPAVREVFLIDGPSLAYRAFYALPESMATGGGMPTNAIFGFSSMLVRIIAEHGMQPALVAWDRGSSGRKQLYADYKAQRAERPELLNEQWPALLEVVEAIGFQNVELDGYEADDVIASLAEQARSAESPCRVTIVTGDRDAFQLIGDDGLVSVMATTKGVTDTKLYDRQAVIDRYGLPPELIPDYYGLKGDSSDNIPGVPGIGEKTAGELIGRFGSLEEVLAHSDEVNGAKRRQSLVDFAEQARMSRDLARMQRDLPVGPDPARLPAPAPDIERIRALFGELELRAPLRRLEAAIGLASGAAGADSSRRSPRSAGASARADGGRRAAGGPAAGGERSGEEAGQDAGASEHLSRARLVTLAELAEMASGELAGRELALALRRDGAEEGALFDERPERFGFALSAGEALLLAGDCGQPGELIDALGELPLVVHDAKALGVIPRSLAHDTLLAGYLLEPARRAYPLGELCALRAISAAAAPEPAAEALMIAELAAAQRRELAELGLERLLLEVELPLVAVLRAMEVAGVRLNVERFESIGARVRGEIAELEAKIHALAGEEFLISSPAQLARVLFEQLGLPRKRRGKTGYSTDARVLQAIRDEHEIVPLIERWRELSTLIKTYFEVLPRMVDQRQRLHTTFLQASAQTGRLASTNPNLQNIPVRTPLGREIRGCFEAEGDALLIAADYSQIELRVLAHVADEQVLKEIFRRGEDVHTATAAEVFERSADQLDPAMRAKAKMVNYGIVYGLSDFGLADRLNISRAEAKAFIDAYLLRFPKVAEFMEQAVVKARADGFVRTLWGRRRAIPELNASSHQLRSQGERLAVNTIVQGSAADIIKLAMLACASALSASELSCRLILTIHDELLFEVAPDAIEAAQALIEREMCGVWPHDPPLAVEIGSGRNWLQAK